jgi:hypothetical protein
MITAGDTDHGHCKHSPRKKGKVTPLGCLGRTALRWEQCGVITPIQELLKFRNLKECECTTVAERYRVLPPVPLRRTVRC